MLAAPSGPVRPVGAVGPARRGREALGGVGGRLGGGDNRWHSAGGSSDMAGFQQLALIEANASKLR